MSNATRTLDPVNSLNHSMPAAERVMMGDRLEELANNLNALVDAINAAGVAGLTISDTLKVTPPSQM